MNHPLVHSHDPSCIFCKIVAGSVPSQKVYEDEDVLAFKDIAPWAPIHVLIIPKAHIPSLAHASSKDPAAVALLGKITALAGEIALQEGAPPYPEGGFRLIVNTGAQGGQEVHHVHFHVLAGPRPWTKGAAP